MVAGDLMTETVTSVAGSSSVRDVALLLLDSHIGAVPVIDESGAPVGMVSDGDLLGRRTENERKDWWLDLLAHDTTPTSLSAAVSKRSVRDVMTTALVSVSPYTPVREVVRLLQSHRIKRLPVVLEGKLVGIISRTDLLNLVAHLPKTAAEQDGSSGGLYGMLQALAGGAHHAAASDAPASTVATKAAETKRVTGLESLRGAIASTFIAGLELSREGRVHLHQDAAFAPIGVEAAQHAAAPSPVVEPPH